MLALEERFDGREIGIGDGEEGLRAGSAWRNFRVGREAVDDRLRPWRDVSGVWIAATVEIDSAQKGAALDRAEHYADAVGVLCCRPPLCLVARRPGSGVVGRSASSRPGVVWHFRRPAGAHLLLPADPDLVVGESGEGEGAHLSHRNRSPSSITSQPTSASVWSSMTSGGAGSRLGMSSGLRTSAARLTRVTSIGHTQGFRSFRDRGIRGPPNSGRPPCRWLRGVLDERGLQTTLKSAFPGSPSVKWRPLLRRSQQVVDRGDGNKPSAADLECLQLLLRDEFDKGSRD